MMQIGKKKVKAPQVQVNQVRVVATEENQGSLVRMEGSQARARVPKQIERVPRVPRLGLQTRGMVMMDGLEMVGLHQLLLPLSVKSQARLQQILPLLTQQAALQIILLVHLHHSQQAALQLLRLMNPHPCQHIDQHVHQPNIQQAK